MVRTARYGAVTVLFLLAGCDGQVDLLFYPDSENTREVRRIEGLRSIGECQERAAQLAHQLGDPNLEEGDFACGLNAQRDDHFGRSYRRLVRPGLPQPEPEPEPPAASPPPSRSLSSSRFASRAEARSPSEPSLQASNPRTGWQVQLAAFRTEAEALEFQRQIMPLVEDLAPAISPAIIEADLGERGVYFRVRLTEYEDAGQAHDVCAWLKARDQDCYVTRG